MPTKKGDKTPETPDTNEQLLSALGALTQTIANMDQRMQALEAAQATPQPMPAAMPVAHPLQPQPLRAPAAPQPTGQRWFIRIKPYNRQLGHLRLNQYFDEITRLLKGGTGLPGDIPEWVEVPEVVAYSMTKYRQRDGDLSSPQVLDIVTLEQKELIDQQEQHQRMATMGVAGMTPTQVLNSAAQVAQAPTRAMGGMQPAAPPPIQPPSMVAGAEAFHAGTPQPLPPVETVPGHMGGRAAALAGLTPAPAPAPVAAQPQAQPAPEQPSQVMPAAAPPPPPTGAVPAPAETETNVEVEDLAEEAADLAETDPGLNAAAEQVAKQPKRAARGRILRGKA